MPISLKKLRRLQKMEIQDVEMIPSLKLIYIRKLKLWERQHSPWMN
jgi:hypothetical protein